MRSGRNNLQNDRLLKASDGDDLWFHAQKYHSSFIVIKTEGREVPSEVLIFAAELCAHFSGGNNSGKIPVDYCQRKKVKKPSGAKAGFVVYNEYKTLLVTPNPHAEHRL
ncbi:MAG: NFACT RNA binding domain-containing protein [Christensenellaceae bacterium]